MSLQYIIYSVIIAINFVLPNQAVLFLTIVDITFFNDRCVPLDSLYNLKIVASSRGKPPSKSLALTLWSTPPRVVGMDISAVDVSLI